ncbi:hypothetical protein [Flavisolibacter tropicus]|uniref:Uncharacterized protein n=1 Tax=Flavisolibacter tropicus TaxID=1492898 RepID=A0A172TQW7_9BACT|nr:hypothetical protein [Flavisolibacter tropicus]ANE49398.1 hypothetical protein SY85_01655 [Flavisolibacter tropicus]
MAFSASTVASSQPAPVQPAKTTDHTGMASLLATLMLTMYAAQKSKKQMRKLKRKAAFTLLKLKMQSALSPVTSMFSKQPAQSVSNRTLLYILLGVAFIILLFVSWPAAIVLLLLGILLVLLMK